MNPNETVVTVMDPSIFTIKGNKYALNPFSSQKNIQQSSSCENTVEIPDNIIGEPLRFLCQDCGVTFEILEEYDAHLFQVHGKRPANNAIAACNVCGATFKRQDHLKRHVRSFHHDEKFYNCPVCKKYYINQVVLLDHIKTKHGGTCEAFYCRVCAFQCSNYEELAQHETIHLNADRHPCTECGATFKRRDHMLRHVKSQHTNQSINCPICNQAYKRRDHVTRHIREKHRMGFVNNKLITFSDITDGS